jgi:glycosyltransferase involved in cell wall biosynthesis
VKRRLLFIVNVDWFFLSHRLPLAIAARDAGFEVHVATALTGPAEAIERHGLKLHALTMDRRSAGPMDALALLLAMRALMRQLQPQVVHLVTIKPVLLGGLAARWCGIPVVVAAISGLGFVFTAQGALAHARRLIVGWLYRLALARPGVHVIFQNTADQALLQRHAGIRAEQSVLIRGSGVDLSLWREQPQPPGPPVVLLASRLLKDKGVREFVVAARRLHGHAGARFVLVGDVDTGNPTSIAPGQLAQWVGEGAVEWWGHRSDMRAVLASAHIVVLPSYREGLPKVLIEAAACGRAVVTTDVPGCRDAILPDDTGLLVAPRDASALVTAIRQLLDDPARRNAMGHAGRRWAEEAFDVRQVVVAHLRLYEQSGSDA